MQQKILLLSCCAPCSCAVIKTMAQSNQNFAVIFYNPNIRPFEEYEKRKEENKKVCQIYGIDFIELEYDNENWCKHIKGLENEPERGKRCSICFYMRLKRAAEYAKTNSFTRISSVLGISRWKDFDQVCRAGKKVETETGVIYDTTNWRKEGRLEKSEKLSKELGLYRQKYCGCKPKS